MCELNICLHIFPPLLNRLISYLALIVGIFEALLDPFLHCFAGFFGELIDVALFQRYISGSDGVVCSGLFLRGIFGQNLDQGFCC